MAKQIVRNVSFNSSTKTVTLNDFTTLYLERILLVVDATHNRILYNFADSTLGATVSGNVITLINASMTSLANTDAILVIYDTVVGDPVQPIDSIGGVDLNGALQPVGALVSDAGQNALITSGNRKEVSYSTAVSAAVASVDCSNYTWVSVQITNTGISGLHSFQVSNDNVNWGSAALVPSGAASGGPVTSSGATGIFHGPISARYFRVNVTGITSGTATGVVDFFSAGRAVQSTGITTGYSVSISGIPQIQGTVAEAGVAANNPIRMGAWDGTNIRTLLADSSGRQIVVGPNAEGGTVLGNPIRVGGSDGTNIRSLHVNSTGNLYVIPFDAGTGQAANVPSGADANQFALLTAGNRKEVSFTTTTAQALATTDVSNYAWVSVHIVGQGTSSTVTFQGSNDNVNWVAVALQSGSAVNGLATTSTTTTNIFYGPANFRYFRLNVTGITAGTTSGVVEFFSTPMALASMGVGASQSGVWTVTQSGAWTVGQSGSWSVTATGAGADAAAISGNPVRVAGSDGANTRSLATDATGKLNVNAIQSGAWTVASTQSGTWTVNQGGAWTVAATQSGAWISTGAAAEAAAVSGNPVRIAGWDGVNARTLKTDASGNQLVVQSGAWTVSATQSGTWVSTGAAAEAAAVSGNPVRVAGWDGTNARTLRTDGSGNQLVAQSGAWTVAATQSGAWTVSQTGTWNVNAIQSGSWTATSVGSAAEAAAASGNPVRIAGWDGANIRTLKTDASGNQLVVQSGTWNVGQSGAWTVAATQSGTWTVNQGGSWTVTATGAGADGAAVSGNAVRVAGSDGANTRTIKTDTSGNQTVIPTGHATLGGVTPYKLNSAASTNATSVKAAAGQVYSIFASNTNAAPRYLKFYNKASAPTVGTDTPIFMVVIPGNTAGSGAVLAMSVPLQFTTGIAFAITGGAADSDTTAVGANENIVSLGYL